MKIKYTGSYESISIFLSEKVTFVGFKRNQWNEIPDNLAKIILRDNPNFFCEDDFIFHTQEFLESKQNICILRFGALGDLIQLLPIMRWMKKNSKSRFTLATSKQYVEPFKSQTDCFDNVIENSKMRKNEYDKVIWLDGVLENDHSLVSAEREIHRTLLYEKFFGVKLDSYDFSFKTSDESLRKVETLLK